MSTAATVGEERVVIGDNFFTAQRPLMQFLIPRLLALPIDLRRRHVHALDSKKANI